MKRTLAVLPLSIVTLFGAWTLAGPVAIEMKAAAPVDDPAAGEPRPRAVVSEASDGRCGGEPCDAVLRGLIDPATNAPSAETFVDVWRAVPTVNDVKLTGPDGLDPWPTDPNPSGGYQLGFAGRSGRRSARAGASGFVAASLRAAPPPAPNDRRGTIAARRGRPA